MYKDCVIIRKIKILFLEPKFMSFYVRNWLLNKKNFYINYQIINIRL